MNICWVIFIGISLSEDCVRTEVNLAHSAVAEISWSTVYSVTSVTYVYQVISLDYW